MSASYEMVVNEKAHEEAWAEYAFMAMPVASFIRYLARYAA